MASSSSLSQAGGKPPAQQRIIIVRHGERLDNVDNSWTDTAARPYDPPLTEKGVEQARETGKRFVGKEIHNVITSPFLRCLQTAQQICKVLSLPGLHTCNRIVDVLSSHCGIYEQPVVPNPGIAAQGVQIVELDTSKLPKYPERTREGIRRFSPAYSKLADTYWPHNIVIVTHGYGVQEAVVKGGGSRNVWVDYCGYVELIRSNRDSDNWTMADHGNIDILCIMDLLRCPQLHLAPHYCVRALRLHQALRIDVYTPKLMISI